VADSASDWRQRGPPINDEPFREQAEDCKRLAARAPKAVDKTFWLCCSRSTRTEAPPAGGGRGLCARLTNQWWNGNLTRVLSAMTNIPAILIVENEALVRLSGVGTFADGFRVIEAINCDDALGLLEVDSDVQLLFTDVSMPGKMNGLALAQEVHERWPHIGIMVVSGQSVSESQLPSGSRFFRKPYCPDSVVRHAHERLRGHPAALASITFEKVA
jgi:CheY-like chemotaxis protein